MPNNSIYDFAIIGCGMAGASIAYELSKSSARVLVIESEALPAYHTTGRSAAFYMEAYGNEDVRKITQASRDFFDRPPEHFCENPILLPCGALYLGTEKQKQHIETTFQTLSKRIDHCQLVDHSFIKNKIPRIKENIQHGFWEPNSMEIDVAELLSGYIKLAKQNQVHFSFNTPCQNLQKTESAWLINRQHQAHTLINAGGAWADHIAQQAKAKPLGLVPKQRNICVAKVESQYGSVQNWPLSLDIDEQFYFKPSGEHLLITPADEIQSEAHDAQADDFQIALGIDRVQNVLDIEFTHILRQWAGLRTFSADKSPVVGFDPDISNFFWLAGQGGYGIQMAPALAKLAASLLTKNADFSIKDLNLENVSPARLH